MQHKVSQVQDKWKTPLDNCGQWFLNHHWRRLTHTGTEVCPNQRCECDWRVEILWCGLSRLQSNITLKQTTQRVNGNRRGRRRRFAAEGGQLSVFPQLCYPVLVYGFSALGQMAVEQLTGH
ncbi:hypothetical protein DPEC_G00291030 [Dallia pectoralis]|uniref:Uncharacterized protein n=1 Tax=Dallia pectoralis TaxID=75939 RepID=A0ACC2FHJ2_DALPE|nr:hypothetical protein DPEC_G00291030 [Dallia pectoralis]